jgi:hypothetical protein
MNILDIILTPCVGGYNKVFYINHCRKCDMTIWDDEQVNFNKATKEFCDYLRSYNNERKKN